MTKCQRQRRRPKFYHVCRDSFHHERRAAGLTQREAAQYLGVTERTIRNWEKGAVRIPYPAFRLIRMRAGGIVHVPGWEGWKFGPDGSLFSPDGRSFKSWELYHLRLVFSMAEHFRQQHGNKRAEPPRSGAVEPARLRVIASGGAPC
jgi:transcriptional regulator with XRE-family HTH domain